MNKIQPIETSYKGFLFRSRLEARWAVFFDELGIEWQYETEGFEINGEKYLPDFYLPQSETWVEVKGDKHALERQWERMVSLLDFGGCLPNFANSRGTTRGLLLLGEIPYSEEACLFFHPIIQHHKGLLRSFVYFNNYVLTTNFEDALVRQLLEVDDEFGLDCSENGWLVETRIIKLKRYYKRSFDAYRAARQSRFEFKYSGAIK